MSLRTRQINLATGTYGILGVPNGGTGLATITAHQILRGNGTSALTADANATFNGTTLAITGAGTFSSTLGVTGTATLNTTVAANLTLGPTGFLYWNGRAYLNSPSAGIVQALASDGTTLCNFQSLLIRFGTATPEAAVTAPVGAEFHRTDGGAVTSFYIKESGAGNTGWVAK